MPLQLDDLAALDQPAPDASGRPMLLPLDGIDEDPEQPRHEFDANGFSHTTERGNQHALHPGSPGLLRRPR